MNRGWRLFVAAPLPGPALATLEERLAGLRDRRPEAHWVPPERLHLTLRFLGQQPPERVPDIRAALTRLAATRDPFDVRLSGSGAFGRAAARPRVCWLGLDPEGTAQVVSLARAVEAAVAPLALVDPGRPAGAVRVHLTVARRAPADLPQWLETVVDDGPVIGWRVDRLRLYRSHLDAAAPRYVSLWTGRLGDRVAAGSEAIAEGLPG
ncbi:MAG TPA: RNA 2',3'-cyclic phosphodiesterase [Candidatus Limnocylindrales bacterium]|nr:RNA 2',3'-cyclic phosphodiesterase [Candidatus Limnocylindrales bacterium]